MPANLAAQCVEHGVFDDGQFVLTLERAFQFGVEGAVQCCERAPPLRTDFDGVVGDPHVILLVRFLRLQVTSLRM